MNTRIPKVIDLFSGAGGMSSGFVSAGFQIIAALESIPVFAATHKENFPNCVTICRDITTLSAAEFSLLTGACPEDIDVVIGGPPCQPFSNIGAPKINSLNKNNNQDERKNLVYQFLEYVEYFSPKAILIENVPQLRTKDGGQIFNSILKRLFELGYKTSWSQLNAVEYGVPQNRRRLFIAGVKGDEDFKFPEPSHYLLEDDNNKGVSDSLFPLEPAVTVKEAIDDLPKIQDGARFDLLPYSKTKSLSTFQLNMRQQQKNVGNNVCRMSNDRAKQVFAHMKPGMNYMDLLPEIRRILPFREDIFHDRLKRLVPNRPSWTVLAHIGMDGYMYIHPWDNRTLSVREAARIQSFSDSFRFIGNMREQYVQVGNAVPPLLAKALATKLLNFLDSTWVD